MLTRREIDIFMMSQAENLSLSRQTCDIQRAKHATPLRRRASNPMRCDNVMNEHRHKFSLSLSAKPQM